MMSQHRPSPHAEDDPLFVRTRREAYLILGMWLACFLYSVPYCYLNGYLSHEALPEKSSAGPAVGNALDLSKHDREPSSLTYPLGLGIPDWVFWGIFVPWGVCILATIFFCLFIYHEEDLGAGAAGEED